MTADSLDRAGQQHVTEGDAMRQERLRKAPRQDRRGRDHGPPTELPGTDEDSLRLVEGCDDLLRRIDHLVSEERSA